MFNTTIERSISGFAREEACKVFLWEPLVAIASISVLYVLKILFFRSIFYAVAVICWLVETITLESGTELPNNIFMYDDSCIHDYIHIGIAKHLNNIDPNMPSAHLFLETSNHGIVSQL